VNISDFVAVILLDAVSPDEQFARRQILRDG
jgi:hypothetical protein